MAKKTKTTRFLPAKPRVVHGKIDRAAPAAGGDVRAALELSAARLQGIFAVLIDVAGCVPGGVLSAEEKARLRPLEEELPRSGLQLATMLLETGAGELGQKLPKAAEVDGLRRALVSYEALRAQAARGAKLCADLRVVLSAYAWLQVTTALTVAREAIADPRTSRRERELYHEKLTPLWAHKEAVLKAQATGREAAQEARERDEAAAERDRKEALLLDVSTAIENGWPLDRASLLEAARYFKERGGTL